MGSPPSPDEAPGTRAPNEEPERSATDESDEASPRAGEPNRPLTIDDVPRLGSGAGIAVGCGALVLVAIVAFWLVRGWLLRGP